MTGRSMRLKRLGIVRGSEAEIGRRVVISAGRRSGALAARVSIAQHA